MAQSAEGKKKNESKNWFSFEGEVFLHFAKKEREWYNNINRMHFVGKISSAYSSYRWMINQIFKSSSKYDIK